MTCGTSPTVSRLRQGPYSPLLVVLVFIFSGLNPRAADAQAPAREEVTIYYNRACPGCLDYIQETVVPLLTEAGYTDLVYRDYVNVPANRSGLLKRNDELNILPALQSHLTVFVGERLVLQGHVPAAVVADLLAAPLGAFERMLIYQDKMNGAVEYTAWAFSGEPKTYPIGTPISEYLTWLEQQGGPKAPETPFKGSRAVLPMVLITGFLDGLNPCAFAVLLFFIAFLFTLRRTFESIWIMGSVYIAAIYLAYFLIGLGLMRAMLFAGNHHLMAKIASWLVIGLGLINVKDYFFPRLPVHLRIPTIAHGTIQVWLKRATFPTAAIGGFLVGLCTFPCSGGIYLAVVGLLAARETYLKGLGYLGLYNLSFVFPLFIILSVVGNRRILHRVRLVEQSKRQLVRLSGGLVMIAVGAVILVWFV